VQHSYEELANRLQSAFGVAPKPRQLSEIYDVAVHKKDVIVVAGTGSGKSLVFQAISKAIEGGIILVISPTIALMDDQVCELNSHLRVFEHITAVIIGIQSHQGLQTDCGVSERKPESLVRGRCWSLRGSTRIPGVTFTRWIPLLVDDCEEAQLRILQEVGSNCK